LVVVRYSQLQKHFERKNQLKQHNHHHNHHRKHHHQNLKFLESLGMDMGQVLDRLGMDMVSLL
jgi:hypothetical protein